MKATIIQILKCFPEIVLVSSLLFPFLAHGEVDRAWPIITFTCDKAKNEVKLKNEVKWGAAGENYPFNAEQGTYNPWSLVSIEKRGKRSLISEKKQLTLKCVLDKIEYTFIVKPKIFNTNFNGKCGDRLSVKVSVYKGASTLIEDKAMEGFCHGNAPVLRGIKVKAETSKVKFYEIPRSRFY